RNSWTSSMSVGAGARTLSFVSNSFPQPMQRLMHAMSFSSTASDHSGSVAPVPRCGHVCEFTFAPMPAMLAPPYFSWLLFLERYLNSNRPDLLRFGSYAQKGPATDAPRYGPNVSRDQSLNIPFYGTGH